ncbi:hypothetical protein BC936DRAFT_143386 [Jimgerdemannia flammicorona]|uniref:Uncharacterized protein n=1 Tax=Jimgerdemannia flammicorona TaxID=994334 RepID=A0A433DDW6_9FUNG|nr:hypothetical protein BC936DRAFT_143386 [Jimgerdemannia flammicorona]
MPFILKRFIGTFADVIVCIPMKVFKEASFRDDPTPLPAQGSTKVASGASIGDVLHADELDNTPAMEKKANLVGDVNPKTSAVGEKRHNDVVAQKPKPKSNELPALPPGPFQGEPFVDIMRCNRPAALGKADIVDIFALGQQQPKGDRLTMCPRPSVGEGRTRQAKAHRWQRQRQEQKCPVPRRGRSMVSRSSNSHGTVHAMSWQGDHIKTADEQTPRLERKVC